MGSVAFRIASAIVDWCGRLTWLIGIIMLAAAGACLLFSLEWGVQASFALGLAGVAYLALWIFAPFGEELPEPAPMRLTAEEMAARLMELGCADVITTTRRRRLLGSLDYWAHNMRFYSDIDVPWRRGDPIWSQCRAEIVHSIADESKLVVELTRGA